MGERQKASRRMTVATAAAVVLILGGSAFFVAATFTANPETVESHAHAGNISSTVSVGTASIAYGTPGLSGYASCVEAPYGPLPTTDVVENFSNAAPGDNCTWTATITDTGSLPGILSVTMGLSSMNICSGSVTVNCYLVGNSLSAGTTTIAAGGTVSWSGYIELAPGSTTQGLLGEVIWNASEHIGS